MFGQMINDDPVIPGFNAPSPESIYELARAEKPSTPIKEYMDAIVVLRDEKGFTFREIAEWMSKNVAETDHNAIYREYNKHKKKELENHEREWGHIERHPEEAVEETAED